MSDISPGEHPNLYRAVKSRSWFTQRSAAFRLRQATEQREAETTLSVIMSAGCTKTYCAAEQNTCFGELVLNTKDVLDAGWKVDKDAPNHAGILGLPLHGSDEQAIEDAAFDLAELVTDEQRRPS